MRRLNVCQCRSTVIKYFTIVEAEQRLDLGRVIASNLLEVRWYFELIDEAYRIFRTQALEDPNAWYWLPVEWAPISPQ